MSYPCVMAGEDAFDARAYTREMRKLWSAAAPHFEAVSSGYFGPATHPFFAFAGLSPGQRVLDVACGPGTSARLAFESVRPRGEVLGVDISLAMLVLARRGAGGPRFAAMDAEALALPDASFDAVLCHLGLMLFARPRAALSEMARVLRPGGTLACLVLGSAGRMAFTSLLTTILPRHAPEMRPGRGPGLADFANPRRLEGALKAAGLREVSSRRLRGTFAVASKDRYWDIALKAFGRIGPVLKRLSPGVRGQVKDELFARLSAYEQGGRLALPYEFVMARGVKPGAA
ncbi:MAG: methyltransferase domain-containing protein [Elusimicrobia bacterium]|nr:methyltransferase domain-containing protein [Elusimicrobiota bacterium]